MPNQVLENVSIIDTPGILTAARRKLSRGEVGYLISLECCPTYLKYFSQKLKQMKLIRKWVG